MQLYQTEIPKNLYDAHGDDIVILAKTQSLIIDNELCVYVKLIVNYASRNGNNVSIPYPLECYKSIDAVRTRALAFAQRNEGAHIYLVPDQLFVITPRETGSAEEKTPAVAGV